MTEVAGIRVAHKLRDSKGIASTLFGGSIGEEALAALPTEMPDVRHGLATTQCSCSSRAVRGIHHALLTILHMKNALLRVPPAVNTDPLRQCIEFVHRHELWIGILPICPVPANSNATSLSGFHPISDLQGA